MVDDGRTIPPWSGRRRDEALAFVRAKGRREKAPCCICRQPIDYGLRHPDPASCSVQHLKSRKLFPHLTWLPSNWAPAHLACNKSAGTGETRTPSLGATSQDW